MAGKAKEVVTEFDLSALPAPEVGRFRTDVAMLREKTRRMDWLLKCGAEEINLDEVATLAAETKQLSIGIENFARRRAS